MKWFVRREGLETTVLDGESVVLNTEGFTVTKLNETGGLIWTLLQEAQTVESLELAISQQCGGLTDSLHQDIFEFLEELLDCKLVTYEERTN